MRNSRANVLRGVASRRSDPLQIGRQIGSIVGEVFEEIEIDDLSTILVIQRNEVAFVQLFGCVGEFFKADFKEVRQKITANGLGYDIGFTPLNPIHTRHN